MNKQSNDTASEFVRNKIRAIVKDKRTAELLAPKDHPIGTKRLCLDTNYYETYNRDNVTLVDVRSDPIAEITATGLRTNGGQTFELDAIVFATGFDAMTGALREIDVRTTDGAVLRDHWEGGPLTYLGLMVSGFPNMFVVTGPGSPGVKTQMIASIEQHVDWIADCIGHLRKQGFDRIEASPQAESEWVRARQQGGRQHALSAGQQLVHGRQHPRQAARVHALCRRLRPLQAAVRRHRRQGLRGLQAQQAEDSCHLSLNAVPRVPLHHDHVVIGRAGHASFRSLDLLWTERR